INSHLCRGAAVVLSQASLTEPAFWKALQDSHATTFGGVPYSYEILKKLRFERMDLPQLRYLTQAGGKLRPSLMEEFCRICYEKGGKFIVMYGQTEATARMSYLPWVHARRKIGSVGIAIPGGRFSLENEAVGLNRNEGELIYQGKNVSLGYAENYH